MTTKSKLSRALSDRQGLRSRAILDREVNMQTKLSEHLPLIKGEGKYIDDIQLPGCLHVAFLRSPHASAYITRINVSRAKQIPGIIDIITAGELSNKILPIVARLESRTNAEYYETPWWPLALTRVRYVGEAVAAVVAETRYIAEDAIELIEVDYDPTTPVVKPAKYCHKVNLSIPPVHDDIPDNIIYRNKLTTPSSQLKKVVGHYISVGGKFHHPRLTGAAIENAGVIAQYVSATDELTIWTSTQVPHLIRDGLSECLKIDNAKIRVVAPHVGGGFGTKMQLLPEELIVGYAAMKFQCAVKWSQDRSENLQASFHARDIEVQAELFGTQDGSLIGIKVRAYCDVGAYSSFPLTAALEPITILGGLTGPYRALRIDYEGFAVASNKCPQGAYRGVGFPINPLILEGLIDKFAQKIEMSPAEVRRRNILTEADFPYKAPTGAVYDSGNYLELLDLALANSNYEEWLKLKDLDKTCSEQIGVGISCYVEPTGLNRAVFRARGMSHIPGFDSANIKVDVKGRIHASVSIATQGQAQASAYTTLISRELGVGRESIHIILGDTARAPYGSGTFNSHGMVSGGGAILTCLNELKRKLEVIAAYHWGVELVDVAYDSNGVIEANNKKRKLSFQTLCRMANSPLEPLPPQTEPGLDFTSSYDPVAPAVSAAVHVAIIRLDVETGRVKFEDYVVVEDCGIIVDKTSVDSQIRGGIAQGIGAALYEQIIYNEDGQFISGTLADYLLPTAGDVPNVKIVHTSHPSPYNLGGFKGVGESGIIGATAAVVNAVIHAGNLKTEKLCLPLTPERILQYLGGSIS